jgi:hypothetical protein
MLAALLLGFTLLVVLTSPGSHPKPAQAQTATTQRAALAIDGIQIAAFGKVDEVSSSIRLPRGDGKAAQLEPIRIVLERNADGNLQLAAWHQSATRQLTGYRRDASLILYDDLGEPKLKLFLEQAWPAEYHLEQQDGQVVERVTLTATSIQRVAP